MAQGAEYIREKQYKSQTDVNFILPGDKIIDINTIFAIIDEVKIEGIYLDR